MINITPFVQHVLGSFRKEKPTISNLAELRRQLDALVNKFFAEDPMRQPSVAVLNSFFGDLPVDPSTSPLSDRDKLFAHNIVELGQRLGGGSGNALPNWGAVRTLRDQDCLAWQVNEWSLLRVLNLAVMSALPVTKEVAIVTSVRNEGLSILEWLAYHRSIGFESFFVYTNDNTDGSEILLRVLAENDLITLIENDVSADTKVQTKILEHSLHLLPHLRAFKWAFYIDVDEFFMSRCEPGLTLRSFMTHYAKSFPAEEPSGVCFNWKWFGSENQLEMMDGLLLERFVYSRHNDHVKSLIRLGDVISMQHVHVPLVVEGGWLADSEFARIERPTIHLKPSYGTGQLNHYWNKSFEEFVLKRRRGRISAGTGGQKLDFSTFFEWGANGRRGNFDPPPVRVVDRAKREYNALLEIEGIRGAFEEVRRRSRAILDEIDSEINIRNLWEKRGRVDN